ncbi:hypothetical protein RHGRI_032034 [Rhododendron griersonianum]|uniref:Uncharacterized protein n=1 Tax=Rhododendron griersonianum TaxID=479676 RepID=A0AAV6IAA9_9ERIC|nr:hypothetical protein RHGRI_032034 [Rhododendron griersonianum]
MDKNWMKMGMTADGRISQLYYNGVTLFIQFARAVVDAQGNILCPSWNKTKHRCGSKSLPVRVAAAMENSKGVVPAVTEMYKSTHFNKDTQKWVSSESQVLYDKMVQIEIEHNAQEGAIPITQEELSVKGLKARSGYVKGLGIRPSSSIRIGNGEYVTHLEGKVQEQADKIQEQAEKIQEQAEGIEAANNKIDELALAKEEQGKTLASFMAFLKQQDSQVNNLLSIMLSALGTVRVLEPLSFPCLRTHTGRSNVDLPGIVNPGHLKDTAGETSAPENKISKRQSQLMAAAVIT